MGSVSNKQQIYHCFRFVFCVVVVVGFSVTAAHQCNHHHDFDNPHHHVHHGNGDVGVVKKQQQLLPEELAEEEDLKLYGYGLHHNHGYETEHKHGDVVELSGLGLWLNAMGCSLLVSLASLICLIILPLLFIQGKPSKAVVDSLALFGAGAMLGDAFLHQLPHAFGGEHSHSHDHHDDNGHGHTHVGESHSHSLKDLSVGFSVLAGIVLFLLVEKLVRYVEEFSEGVNAWSHGLHLHHHKHNKKLKDDNDAHENHQGLSHNEKDGSKPENKSEVLDKLPTDAPNGDKQSEKSVLQKRNAGRSEPEDKTDLDAANISNDNSESTSRKEPTRSQSNLVFGYLNLFSDGVHNFTDGMALGSAFLLYGSVGGWSRTLFLLAHELPQEIGDFGILVRSGFSVSKALFFNFLSALVALAGTALVSSLLWKKDELTTLLPF
ncbi:IAA-alanine resistance 1 [Olea europaea subsp. europaea]|uniref:IAA-alanine resistance 1 n=1 Tax=Olea europaea subsp. europaea TaxID=158383 RepID=A0A8S0USE2_OLEEU|nr:IAA-alanine resistance 1 [Olea europaea subsp. europaea]